MLFLNSLVVLCVVESSKVKIVYSFSLPQTECVDVVCLAADYCHIVGNSLNSLILKGNCYSLVLFSDAPGVFKSLPVVGNFYLIAVLDKLLEKTVFIADAVAVKRNFLCSGTVEIAGCESAQTSVSERCVFDVL